MSTSAKVILITAFIFIYLPHLTLAQAPDTLWTKTFGGAYPDGGSSVQQTADGGYIICGHKGIIQFEDYDVWLIKTNAYGDTLWTKTFGGAYEEFGYSVQQTSDSGYIICGSKAYAPYGRRDVWLIKTNASGNTLWTKTFGGVYGETGNDVEQTTDGGYIVCGSNSSGVWLIKTDAYGDTLWTKTIIGNEAGAWGQSVQQTTDGGYIIAGNLDYYNGVYWDIWLIKTNSNGDTLWTKIFGEAMRNECNAVQQTSEGGYILIGNTDRLGGGYNNIWLIKTNAYGDTLWTKTFGGSYTEYGKDVLQTAEGGYILCGATKSYGAGNYDVWLIKTNAFGNVVWTKTFGGNSSDYGRSVKLTTDGGYVICGRTASFGAGHNDVWLIKTAPDLSNSELTTDVVISDFYLQQNYPNPFNPNTIIKYQIPELSFVTLQVYDVLGNEIETLVNEETPTGSYEIEFDATSLPSGVYFYRLQAGSFVETKKTVLMK